MSVLGILYLLAALLVALYGGNALLLATLYLRRRSSSEPVPPPQDPERLGAGGSPSADPALPRPELQAWPSVTVQLPIYNELYVVKRLIDAVARLDYPRELLQVQILDDSTDDTTRIAQARGMHHRSNGTDVIVIHRRDRRGFKAGALAGGLQAARGELIAIFDADFVPPPDFLKRTVPHLVADPDLAFVQARWGYLNADYSTLTRAQTIALDGHFVVEHLGRNRNGLLMNFNGTAGVWRRQAIEAAGGWQGDTLTEDVDLSFRAQLCGWRALYLPDVVAPAELPPQIAAFKQQQARWATGAAQCLVKLSGSLWRGALVRTATDSCGQADDPGRETYGDPAARLSWPARLEAFLHLSVWLAHPMSLVLLLLTLPMLLGQIPITFNLTIFWLVAMGPTFAYGLSQRHLYGDWKGRMLYMPVLALLGTGLALSNTAAIAHGLVGRRVPFRRTPKFRIEGRGDRWIGNRYALPVDGLVLGELALAVYSLVTIGFALTLGNYLAVPFLLLYAGGYAFIALHGLRDAWRGAGRHRRRRLRRAAVPAESRIK